MLPVERLQQRENELRTQADILSKKIARLRADLGTLAAGAGTSAKFQLEAEIADAETERDRLYQQIDDIGIQCVYNSMLNMDHFDHVLSFRQYINNRRIGAFLIHGSPHYGQLWLLKRLLVLIHYVSVTPLIHFDLLSGALRKDTAAFWSELGSQLGMPRFGTGQDVIKERVCERLQTQNVILIVRNVDTVSEELLSGLINQFWLPLANAVYEAGGATTEYKLLMFLVDYSGLVPTWHIPFADLSDPEQLAHFPLRLPVLDLFTTQILTQWMNLGSSILPVKALQDVTATVQDILDQSDNGVPEKVADQICRLCDSYYEGEGRWLKL